MVDIVRLNKKARLNSVHSTRNTSKCKDTNRLKVQEWRKVSGANTSPGKPTLISDRVDVRAGLPGQKRSLMVTRGSGCQEDMIILDIYTLVTEAGRWLCAWKIFRKSKVVEGNQIPVCLDPRVEMEVNCRWTQWDFLSR